MSVSMWSYCPEVCDGGGCPGDCDLCDKPKNMEDEDDIIKCKDKTDLRNMMDQLDHDGYDYTVNGYTITVVGGIRYD